MTGQEKASLLLLKLPSAEADRVLARLDRERSERLRVHMQRFRQAPPSPEVYEQILTDLDHLLREQVNGSHQPPAIPGLSANGTAAVPAPTGEASQAAASANGTAHAPELPDEAASAADPLAALRALSGTGPAATAAGNVDRLALALSDEHPRTVALVLAQMEPERGGEVLRRLHPEMRRQVSLQLGREVSVHPELITRIVRTVLSKCRTLVEAPPAPGGGNRFKRVAEMLRRLDKPDRMEILAALEQNDPQGAVQIKEYLYAFEDLLNIEDRSMQKLLAEVDSKSLASALKGATEAIRDKVRNNLSKRARETLTEEMDLQGSLPPTTIQQAQKSIVEVIQRLDQAGELTMVQ